VNPKTKNPSAANATAAVASVDGRATTRNSAALATVWTRRIAPIRVRGSPGR